jgi:hypothetical protein
MATTTIAAILFGLAALGGATMAALRLRGGNPPLGLAIVHGLGAAAGLVTLLVAVLAQGERGTATVSLVLFVVAALGGFFLIAKHLKGEVIPLGVVFLHGTLAVAGFVALLVHVLR